jgi:hypothetical protein
MSIAGVAMASVCHRPHAEPRGISQLVPPSRRGVWPTTLVFSGLVASVREDQVRCNGGQGGAHAPVKKSSWSGFMRRSHQSSIESNNVVSG